MADISLPGLPAVSAPNSTDLVPIEHGASGGPYTTSVTTIAELVTAGGGGGGGATTLGALTDIDQTTAGAGKVLTDQASGGHPFSFQTPSGGATNYDALIESESSLTQYWPLNDASGTTSPQNLKGSGVLTLNNVTFGYAPLAGDGETVAVISAVIAGGITGPNSLIPNLTTGPWTAEFIFNGAVPFQSSEAGQAGLFTPDNSGGAYTFMNATSAVGGAICLYNGAGSIGYTVNGSGKRMHVAITYSGGTIVVYVNGIFYCQATCSVVASQSFGFGCRSTTTGEAMQGRIGKLAFYNAALSVARINAHVAAAGL